MKDASHQPAHVGPPGTEEPRRFRPKLRYELIGCGLHGHEIVGMDAAALRAEDELFARESGRPALVPVHALRLVGSAHPAGSSHQEVPALAGRDNPAAAGQAAA